MGTRERSEGERSRTAAGGPPSRAGSASAKPTSGDVFRDPADGVLQRLDQALDQDESFIVCVEPSTEFGPEGRPREAYSTAVLADEEGPPPVQEDPQDEDVARPGARRYVLHGELGRGGMGVILSGFDVAIRREVAIKVMRGDRALRSGGLSRFIEEARIQGQLEHPSICPVHEIGVDARGRHYFTMKKVWGRSLAEFLDADEDEPRHTLVGLLQLFLKVCDAVAFAHSRGVVHRDLKPSNVMVGEYGEVLVMDWGLAKVKSDDAPNAVRTGPPGAEGRRSGDGAVVGTPAYMSPEQAAGTDVDERSDIYSLGAILYQLLTGTAPFRGGSAADVLEEVRAGRLEPPSKRLEEDAFPHELDAVVMRAMACDPARRYRNVAGLQADVQAFLDGRALAAVSYNPLQLLWKWLSRHRVIATATLSVAVVAASLLGYFRWSAARERRRELLAREAAVVDEAQLLHRRWDVQRRELARLDTEAALPLHQPNGEPVAANVEAWYRARDEALASLERLAALEAHAPTAAARVTVDRQRVDRLRRHLCLEAARKAATLGDYNFARGWLARAVDAGLAPSQQAKMLGEIDAMRSRRVERDLDVARGLLARAREPASMEPGFLEAATVDLVRRGSADLVRLLLDSRHADSSSEWERRLVIDVLGRLGDTKSKGPDGLDAVEVLTRRLTAIDLEMRLEEAVALARALGLLGDARAHEPLHERRRQAGPRSAFSERTRVAYARIPLPAALLDGGERAPRTASDLVERGQRHAARGNHAGALADYTRALELDAGRVGALLHRGDALLELGRTTEALRDFDRAVASDPRSVEALARRGRTLVELGRLEEALADYDRALEIEPDHGAARNGRAVAHHVGGDLTAALADYDRLVRSHPTNASARNNRGVLRSALGDRDGALADYNAAIRLDPEGTRAFMNRGVLHGETGRHGLAIADLTVAVRIDPHDHEAWANRGASYLAKGLPAQARADFGRAMALEPGVARYAWQRGRARQLLRDFEGALADYEHALRIDPAYGPAHRGRGQALFLLERPGESLRAFEEALRVSADDYRAHYDRATVLRALGRGREAARAYADAARLQEGFVPAWLRWGRLLEEGRDLAGAEAVYDRGLQAVPDDARLLGRRGDVRRRTGDLHRALADLGRSLELAPDDADTLFSRALAYARLGRHEDALKDLDAALERAPDERRLHLYRGLVELLRDRPAAALEDLTRALADDPADAAALVCRAEARRRSGDLGGAVADLEAALEEEPASPHVRLELARCHALRAASRTAGSAGRRADLSAALGHARRLLRLGSGAEDVLVTDPDFELLRVEERFQRLLDR